MGNATAKLVLRKAKSRPDGSAPIYIRATHARRTRERSTGVWVDEKKWNAARQQVRKSHPLAIVFNARLADMLNEARARATTAQTVDDIFRERAGTFTAFDKLQLLKGEATQRTETTIDRGIYTNLRYDPDVEEAEILEELRNE